MVHESNRKSTTQLKWSRKKSQIAKVLTTISNLSPTRLNLNSTEENPFSLIKHGGAYQVVLLCHVLDSSSSSPLLSALNKFCTTNATKSKFASLYATFRPPSNLDEYPKPTDMKALVFSSNDAGTRSTNKTLKKREDITVMVVDAVVSTGLGCEGKALKVISPAFASAAAAVGVASDDDQCALMNTTAQASIQQGDVIIIPEPPSSQQQKTIDTSIPTKSYLVQSINFIDGGVIVIPRPSVAVSKIRKKKTEEVVAAVIPSFISLLSLLGCTVLRNTQISDTTKTICFSIPPPSISQAFAHLNSFAEADLWKKELSESTDIMRTHMVEQAKEDGTRTWHDEKECRKLAVQMLNSLDFQTLVADRHSTVSPSVGYEKWIVIGKCMRSVSADLLDVWSTWSANSLHPCFDRKSCVVEWAKFRPKTSYDHPSIAMARANEVLAKERLRKAMLADGIGEFEIHRAEMEVERSGREGVGVEEFERVVFEGIGIKEVKVKVKERGDDDGSYARSDSYRRDDDESYRNEEEEDEEEEEGGGGEELQNSYGMSKVLMVPSLTCETLDIQSMGSNADSSPSSISPSFMIPCEVRKNDKILLSLNNTHSSKSFGVGMGVDSTVLLKTRAERQIFGKNIHKEVIKAAAKEEEMKWSTVLDLNPLKALICVTLPSASKPKHKPNGNSPRQWITLGSLWGAWVYRENESEDVGTLFRLPNGDMYWGLEALSKEVADFKAVSQRTVELLQAQSKERGEAAVDLKEGGEGRSDAPKTILKAALKCALVEADAHNITIAWSPGGASVDVSITQGNQKEWKLCFIGTSNACAIKNLAAGSSYKFKLEAIGRRPQFAAFATTPLPPPKLIATEWVVDGGERALKVNVVGGVGNSRVGEESGGGGGNSSSLGKRSVRVEARDVTKNENENENENKNEAKWISKGEAKDKEDVFLVKGLRIGSKLAIRSRFILGDGKTFGEPSEAVNLGRVPRRCGLIMLEFPEEVKADYLDEDEQLVNEGENSDGEERQMPVRSSNAVAQFTQFVNQLQNVLTGDSEIDGDDRGEEEEEKGLKKGWQRHYSDSKGDYYYFNESEGVSSWIRP